jgi:hypothetical protein
MSRVWFACALLAQLQQRLVNAVCSSAGCGMQQQCSLPVLPQQPCAYRALLSLAGLLLELCSVSRR